MKHTEPLYKKTVLPNGLRIVTEKVPSVRSITIGVWVDVGSRNEKPDENGISHLIEHMLFKGTKTRSAKQIASALESIGGTLNAFTSKEQTCYIARVLDDHLDTAVDVLADITCRATLTPTNLLKEKKVVCEEILESEENPSDHIHDVFTETFWGDHPLGKSILGTADVVTKMPRSKILKYIKNNYRSHAIVIAASGSVSHAKLVRLVKENFEFESGQSAPYEPAQHPQTKRYNFIRNNNNQVHLCIGYPGLTYGANNKMVALALHSYLGGGMSSRLFQKIREDKGLAYTVYTFLDLYRDGGLFGTYAATDKKNFAQTVEITVKELNRLRKYKLKPLQLDEVKAQLKGHLTLGMESTSSRMNRLGRNEIMLGQYNPLKKTLRAIDKVTATDISDLVNDLFDHNRAAMAVLGPVSKKELGTAL